MALNDLKSITTPKIGWFDGDPKRVSNSIKILSHHRDAPVRSAGPTGQAENAEKNISFTQSASGSENLQLGEEMPIG